MGTNQHGAMSNKVYFNLKAKYNLQYVMILYDIPFELFTSVFVICLRHVSRNVVLIVQDVIFCNNLPIIRTNGNLEQVLCQGSIWRASIGDINPVGLYPKCLYCLNNRSKIHY